MATTFAHLSGPNYNAQFGTAPAGVATLQPTDSATNYTVTFQALDQIVPVGTAALNQVLVGTGANGFGSSSNLTFDGTALYANAKANFGAVGNASPAAGDFWYDSTRKTFLMDVNGLPLVNTGVMYVQTASVTLANSTTETSLIGAGLGTLTLPANWATVGKTIRVRSHGYISDTATPSTTLKIKLGSVTLITSTGTLPSGLSNAGVLFEFDLTFRSVGATGAVIGQGTSRITSGAFVSSLARALVMAAPATVDTTVPNTLDVTYQWGTASASNTITITNMTLEVIA